MAHTKLAALAKRRLGCAVMRLLDRYLLRELLIPLGFCLAGFFIFWIAFDLVQQLDGLLQLKLTLGDIARYYLVLAPKFMVIVMPIGFLLALLMTLTGLSRHNEIVAIRTAGVSLWRLSLPYFAVALVASVTVFAVNELWVPDSVERADQIKFSRSNTAGPNERYLKRKLGFTNTREDRQWFISVFNARTAQMDSPQVTWTMPDGSRRQLFAERAIPTNGGWLFFNARMYREGKNPAAPPIPMLQTNPLFMAEFTETPDSIRSEITMSARLRDRRIKEVDVPISDILRYLRLHPNPERKDRNWLYTEFHGRLAAPWTCLVVVLIALPFGAASGRRNAFVGVASAIFICFGFHILQQFGLALGASGWVPPWVGGWFPNLAFGTVGLWLTARVR